MPEVQTQKQMHESLQVVVFSLGKEEYAVPINQAREIIKTPHMTHVPDTPGFVRGIIDVRGQIVVVVDLLRIFETQKIGEHVEGYIILAEINENVFGIIVDNVSEILRIAGEDIRKPPAAMASRIHKGYIRGIGILGEGKRLLIILELAKILSEKELQQLAELSRTMKREKPAEPKHEKPKISDAEIEKRLRKKFEEEKNKIEAKEEGTATEGAPTTKE